jgi:integrase
MARPRSWPPQIYHHKKSGEDRVALYDANGKRYWVTLGKTGSDGARQKYARIIAEYQPDQPKRVCAVHTHSPAITVAAVVSEYLDHRLPGADYRERKHLERIFGAVVQMHGTTPVAEFGPRQLEQVRSHLVAEKLNGKLVNKYIGKVRAAWKWSYQREIITLEAYVRLTLLPPLTRSNAPGVTWHDPVEDVPGWVVDATLPYLHPIVADMVRLQRLAGLRPGEVVQLRPMDIDRETIKVDGVPIWVYSPERHKKKHRGKRRQVPLGPQAQAVLLPYLDRPADSYCFSPREALGAKWAARKSRTPGERYLRDSYGHAIGAAIASANRERLCPECREQLAAVKATRPKRAPRGQAKPAKKRARPRRTDCAECRKLAIPTWHPHRLRHSAATVAHAELGIEAAQAMLGHDSPDTTRIYSHAQLLKAARAAAKLG